MKHIFLSIIPPSNIESQVYRIKRALFSRFHMPEALSLPPMIPLTELAEKIDKKSYNRKALDAGLGIVCADRLILKNNNLYLPVSPEDFIEPKDMFPRDLETKNGLFVFYPGLLIAPAVKGRYDSEEINSYLGGEGYLSPQKGNTYSLGCFEVEFPRETCFTHLYWSLLWSLKRRKGK